MKYDIVTEKNNLGEILNKTYDKLGNTSILYENKTNEF